MVDDGNCLFRGISMECFGSQSWHLAVRHQVVEFMVNNDKDGQFSTWECIALTALLVAGEALRRTSMSLPT